MQRSTPPHDLLWLLMAAFCGLLAPVLAARGQPLPSGLATQGLWLGLSLGLAGLAGPPRRAQLDVGPGRLSAASVALLAIGLLALSDALNLLLIAAELREASALAELDAEVADSEGPQLGLALLILAIAPGICEELFFRGLVQGALVRRFGTGVGVVVAAALFGLAHFEWVHSGAAFLLGLYLGAVARITGSIRACMLCHTLNNLLALLTPRLGLPDYAADVRLVVPGLLLLAGACLFGVWLRDRAQPPGGRAGGEATEPGPGGMA